MYVKEQELNPMASKLYATDKLREYREAKGYTQQEMTSLFGIEADIGLSMSTYQKWEQGVLNITADNALMLSRFTRIELKDLVERK